MLAFSGSRTYHRMACAIEDAGFQIRDQIMWVYGSGFPKSLNISKAIDKAAGVEFNSKPASGVGFMNNNDDGYNTTLNQLVQVGESTAEAEVWDGWGTALKPAHEPIVLARKPIVGTVANNVLTYGTGGINIDGSRVGNESVQTNRYNAKGDMTSFHGSQAGNSYVSNIHEGRFPANFIHDGSEEVLELFPDTKGGTWNTTKGARHFNNDGEPTGYATSKSDASTGSAARFFYCAKASKKDRNEGLDQFEEKRDADRTKDDGAGGDNPRNRSNTSKLNHHPTVKPTELMRYLCRLITPPNGTVLDPFTGSGSTGKAAVLEGFSFIGVEQSEEYIAIAEARIQSAKENK
jgi:site-specific DNA-methyltransferase (adenine-specific)